MKRKIIGYYSILIGVSVIVMWLMLLFTQDIEEGTLELSFHLFSEFLMAILCLVSGLFLLVKNEFGERINLLGLGMLIYSVLNAAGYYGQKQEYSMLVLFIVLFLLTSTCIVMQIRLIKK